MTETERTALIKAARDRWASDEIEIDDNARVSEAGDGTHHWVQAWVYLPKEEA